MRGRTVAAIGTVLVLASMLACHGNDEDPAGEIVASGHVEATDVRVSAKVGGRLVDFALQEGDVVIEGQQIARIDTVDIDLSLAAARAELDRASARLRLSLAGAREEEIAEAEARVQQAEAELDGSEKTLARMQGLLDRGSGTEQARDDAGTRRDVASARLLAARETLRRLRAGSRSEEIDAARAAQATARARVAQLEQRRSDATIVSPVGGVVTEKIAEPGELLPDGAPLAIVTDLASAWLTVYVPEPDLGRIRIGQTARVVTDGGQSRSGRVSFVASEAEFTPKNVQTRDERVKLVFRVKIALDNEDGLFKPGMPAEARL